MSNTKKPFSSLQSPNTTFSQTRWSDNPLYRFVYGSILRPGDAPDTRQQKMVIGGGLIASIVPLAFFVLLSVRISSDGWNDGTVLAWVAMLLLAVAWISINVASRFMEAFSTELHFDLWMMASWSAALLLAVSFPGYPVGTLVASLAVLAAVGRASLLPLHLAILAVVYALGASNVALVGVGRVNTGAPAAGLCQQPYSPDWKEALGWQASVLLLVAYTVVTSVIVALDHSLRENTARRESLLARVVCEELCRLNAGGALIALRYLQYQNGIAPTLKALQKDRSAKEGASEGGTVTADATTQQEDDTQLGEIIEVDLLLLGRLQLLIDRFDRFIPHLPNWLVTSAAFTGNQLAEGEVNEGALAAVTSPVAQPEQDLDMESLEDFLTESDTPRDGDHTPRALRNSLTQMPQSPSDNNKKNTTTSYFARRERGGSGRGSGKDSNNSAGSVELLRHKTQKISYAWVDFARETNHHQHQSIMSPLTPYTNGTPKLGELKVDPISQFVDAVHEAADATYGAVHKFVGDAVEVSWNTVRVTAQCEAKAARFMALLRHFSEAHFHHLTISGAAVTGDAYTLMTGSKQQALTISFPSWRRALKQLTVYANRNGMLLIDDPTYQVGHYTVEARAIDLIRLSRAHDSTRGQADRTGRKSARRTSFDKNTPLDGDTRPPGLLVEDMGASTLHHFDLMPAAPPTRTMFVYEALRDLSAKNTKDANAAVGDQPEEWMYTLANSERQSTVALRKALDFVEEGKFAAAQNVLQACIDSSTVQHSHLSSGETITVATSYAVRRLLNRLQSFEGTTASEFAEDLTKLA